MIKLLLITIVLLAISLVLLGTRILLGKLVFNKAGKFPITSVGHNPEMKKIGISCAKHDEIKCFKKMQGDIYDSNSNCGC
ncbi:MAG: hypothetical protein KAI79_04260 [Bacteroidales bacterium]|nr:hypothetical protein [Bacteroidales bacterium]